MFGGNGCDGSRVVKQNVIDSDKVTVISKSGNILDSNIIDDSIFWKLHGRKATYLKHDLKPSYKCKDAV